MSREASDMHKKILMVVDDRMVTQSAIRQAIGMAHAFRADIHFLYVFPTHGVLGNDILPEAALSNEDFQTETIAHAQKMLAAASELAERAGIHSSRAIGSGSDGAQCVSDAAAMGHCDLIVVGAGGENSMRLNLNGSIASELISVTTVPVLICGDPGSSGEFGDRVSVSIRARQSHLEFLERHRKEKND